MRHLRWVGLVFSLLIVGVLGGLMAPLPSEADNPILTIDGVNVSLTTACASVDSGYTSCYSINTASPYSHWTVGNVSDTNKARFLINDVSTAGSVDAMKLTGITFTPVTPDTTTAVQTSVVMTFTYNAGGGNPKGDYQWAMSMGGYFDPPSGENVVDNQLKLTGTGVFPIPGGTSETLSLGTTLNTGVLTTSKTNNVNSSVTRSNAAATVKAACDTTGGGLCAPTITHTFLIAIKGSDKLYLTDSVPGFGGTCRETGPVPSGLDTTVPNGDPDPTNPTPPCPAFKSKVNLLTQQEIRAAMKAAKGAGAVVSESCVGLCGNGTITINKEFYEGDGPDGTFGFAGSGEDIPASFDLTTVDGTQSVTFGGPAPNGLSTGLFGGTRTITEVVFPTFDNGDYWFLTTVGCTHDEGTDTAWERLYGPCEDCEEGDTGPLLGVTVTNLADNDTLTCTFRNRFQYSNPG
jgi:hypothetical protein